MSEIPQFVWDEAARTFNLQPEAESFSVHTGNGTLLYRVTREMWNKRQSDVAAAKQAALPKHQMELYRERIAHNRAWGETRYRWFDDDVESLLNYIDRLERAIMDLPSWALANIGNLPADRRPAAIIKIASEIRAYGI